METLLVIILIALVIGWFHLRSRMEEMEQRIDQLAAVVRGPVTPIRVPETVEPIIRTPLPIKVAVVPEPPPVVTAPLPRPVSPPAFTTPAPAASPHRSNQQWEAQLGGNWLNKIGVLVLTIGIALALAYSYKYLGPMGRVAASTAISLTMLLSGVMTEKRQKYRVFGRGLIGGGWAALYFTTYAAQALEPARILHNPWVGAILLLAVAAAMIVHSLRYRSQAVTGLAYFVAFVTLAITPITAFSLFAMAPLEASLLYAAHRFRWSKMALFGLIATYVVCATRPNTGAPLWQAQTVFASYWVMFEAFDILSAVASPGP